jgi:hypothetical protein
VQEELRPDLKYLLGGIEESHEKPVRLFGVQARG